ncbi:TAXI family TRAP transporter solute-binding subunit [Moraxella catarrhalis]|uniref:TRAP transporter solute receptor, TAXI family n=1 Tax=Moraxella catarrhalis TaxID=480 RepID=A0A198UGZ6_MORCA|nr:TAXI family TRAP transporter solute-binding subunit [Moraxella catarrhalis]OAU95718.1 TRAP transporter solute receptor, unknown substrate 1 [Moraxella catarrhalis]OAU97469.1 TRAP transporter solute receptor, unknown substrate 1 [Moraxella catarrhalis]OAV03197.1 TRAP transporter solute receptor, unknown substrate 1 [Moraxella catarrhalis]
MKLTSKAAIATLAALTLAACGNNNQTANAPAANSDAAQTSTAANALETKFATIGTGGASGPYNIIGTSLSEIYAQQFGVNSKTQTTGASVENLNLLNQKKLEMAFVMNDALSDAVNGVGSFQQKVDNVQTMATLYPNYVQIATSSKKGISTIDDLRGKRVAVGAQGSGVESSARALLNAIGITYNDITPDYLGFAEAADGLKTGKLDAAFFTSGLPNSSLMELQQGFDLQLVAIPADKATAISNTNNIFVGETIPSGTYGNDMDISTVAVLNSLVVRSDLSENDVYNLTKSFFDNLSTLQTAHQAANGITIENAQQGLIVDLHPGAKKYYDEVAGK